MTSQFFSSTCIFLFAVWTRFDQKGIPETQVGISSVGYTLVTNFRILVFGGGAPSTPDRNDSVFFAAIEQNETQ